MDIPAQTVKTIGLDVVLIPLSITLSGLMQQVTDNSEFDVFYFSISHDFRWGGRQ